jgi:hypothetical protein
MVPAIPEGDIRTGFRSTEELEFFYSDLLEMGVAQGRRS